MWKDPIVEEVRAIREKQAAARGFDIEKIVADAKRKQKASGRRLVSFARAPRSAKHREKLTCPA